MSEILISTTQNLATEIYQKYQSRIPGVMVGLTSGDDVFFSGAGYSNIHTKTSIEPDMSFEIGSICKTMTGYILLRVMKERNININEPIEKYLPNDICNPMVKNIKFVQLFNHSTPLHEILIKKLWDEQGPEAISTYSKQQYIEYLNFQQESNDNIKYVYGEHGMLIACLIVEHIQQTTFLELLSEYIIQPAGFQDYYVKFCDCKRYCDTYQSR